MSRHRIYALILVTWALAAICPAALAKSPIRALIATPPALAGGVKFAPNGGNVTATPINASLRPGFQAGYRRTFEACPGGGACRGVQVILYRYKNVGAARHTLNEATDAGSKDFKTGLGVGRVDGPFPLNVGDPQGRACYFAVGIRGRYYVGVIACRNDVDDDIGLRGLVIATVKLTVRRVADHG